MSLYENSRDLIEVGAYKEGLNPELDRVVKQWRKIEAFFMPGGRSVDSIVGESATLSRLVENG